VTEEEAIQKDWDMDFSLVLRPNGKLVVTSKFIYKINHAANGSIEKYKVRFVARIFSQKEGEYYDEKLSPVSKRSVHKPTTRYMIRSLMSAD
jgi:hypothetical protein